CVEAQGNIFVRGVAELAKRCVGCRTIADEAKQCVGCLPFLEKTPENLVVVDDEAQKIKNGTSQRTVRARGLNEAVRKRNGRIWLLSATPLENNPQELWTILQCATIASEAFGNYKTFQTLFKAKPMSEFGGFVWDTPEGSEVGDR